MSMMPGNIPTVVQASSWSGDPQRKPRNPSSPDTFGIETRRSEVEKTVETFIKVNRLAGWIKVAGTGELTYEITFPMYYIERPSFSQGYELDPASPLEAGNFPSYFVTVSSWQKATAGEIGEYWTGMTLAIVINGAVDQIGFVHWQVEGKAMIDLGQSTEDGM